MKFQAKLSGLVFLVVSAVPFSKCIALDNLSKLDYSVKSPDKHQQALPSSAIMSFSKSTSIGNIELSLHYQASNFESNSFKPYAGFSAPRQPGLLPQITLFSSAPELSTDYQPSGENLKPVRYDRYKDTIPLVYRLTLKGYSIMEYSNNQTDVWSLDKVKDKLFKNPEILFSVTKSF